jgi:5-hydroxyisourate hydrolase
VTSLSTHVLDTAAGRPVAGLLIGLEGLADQTWSGIAVATTDDTGRVADFGQLLPGRYRLVFDVAGHFGAESFYPEVIVSFQLTSEEHYHVPLLISPFAYSTYRGS